MKGRKTCVDCEVLRVSLFDTRAENRELAAKVAVLSGALETIGTSVDDFDQDPVEPESFLAYIGSVARDAAADLPAAAKALLDRLEQAEAREKQLYEFNEKMQRAADARIEKAEAREKRLEEALISALDQWRAWMDEAADGVKLGPPNEADERIYQRCFAAADREGADDISQR